jgi:hypothetical protein
MKLLKTFNLSDVEDPHLYAQMHIDQLIELGQLPKDNLKFDLVTEGYGYKVKVYDSREDFSESLEELGKIFRETMNEIEKESESYWNSLSKEEQLKVFCAVSRRIFEGEIKNKGSYRHVLYSTFGFGPEAYAQAQCSGYLSIHNAIYDGERLRDNIKDFCTEFLDVDNNILESKLDEYVKKLYF